MRYLPPALIAVAVACFAFAYWGLETPEGRRAYDEMAGMIPFGAGLIGVLLVLVAAAIWAWRWFRTRSRRRP